MAKRKRLDLGALTPNPAQTSAAASPAMAPATAPETKSAAGPTARPPIAQVAGEAASGGEMALKMAQEAGRLVISLPLESIDTGVLSRDRIQVDADDMAALKASVLAHGQRTPIEVMVQNGPMPYGLISGWRRLTALRALASEHPQDARFKSVQALVRKPDTLGAAYVAMVEENEIRADLSFYERARVAVAAVEATAFPDIGAAMRALYGAGSKSRRSKIRSFVIIHEQLGDVLVFPAHLTERLGLKVAEALKAGRAPQLRAALHDAQITTAQEEAALIAKLLTPASNTAPPKSAYIPVNDRDPVVLPADGFVPGRDLVIKRTADGIELRITGGAVSRDIEAEMRVALQVVFASNT